MKDPQRDFGQYMRELRIAKKLSMKKLEDLSGVSNAYISNIENGKRGIPSPDVIKKLHGPLGIAYDELMEKAGYLSASVRSELLPETIQAIEDYGDLNELLENAADFFIKSVTNEDGLLKEEYKSLMVNEGELSYKAEDPAELEKFLNQENVMYQIFEHLTFEEKIKFLNFIIKDYIDRNIDPADLLKYSPTNNHNILRVPVLGYIAAGNPICADEHVEEWTKIPNLWNVKEKDVFILKVKGDSMIGSRIYEGDRVVVKVTDHVENGEIAVVNVDGYEATLKRVKKTENGQVILFPDNPKYDPIFITNENARIVGKVIQVMFEP